LPGFGFYNNFVSNDNTLSRVAFSWQQALSSGSMAANNVTGTPVELFHLKIKYLDVNQGHDICFESKALFTDQTFTACGPTGGFGFADCVGSPGTQITNDNFNCSGASISLPVEFISFNAQLEGLKTRLEWTTGSEWNNKGFNIERSITRNDWETIGFVQGHGDTDRLKNYTFYDKNPTSGNNYYRLKQLDFDGAYEYSEIKVVKFAERELLVQELFPNPSATGEAVLNLWSPTNQEAVIRVYDLNGRLYQDQRQELSAGSNRINFELTTHKSIVYLIQLQIGQKTINRKLIVNRE